MSVAKTFLKSTNKTRECMHLLRKFEKFPSSWLMFLSFWKPNWFLLILLYFKRNAVFLIIYNISKSLLPDSGIFPLLTDNFPFVPQFLAVIYMLNLQCSLSPRFKIKLPTYVIWYHPINDFTLSQSAFNYSIYWLTFTANCLDFYFIFSFPYKFPFHLFGDLNISLQQTYFPSILPDQNYIRTICSQVKSP